MDNDKLNSLDQFKRAVIAAPPAATWHCSATI
jgi:hypothetical protein